MKSRNRHYVDVTEVQGGGVAGGGSELVLEEKWTKGEAYVGLAEQM